MNRTYQGHALKVGEAGLVALVLPFLLSACPASVSPAATAAKVDELQCGDAMGEPHDGRLWQPSTVLKVEPMFLYDTCAGSAQVKGVKLLTRRPEGVSLEHATRVLRCASARATLGRADPSRFPNDPFGFPGAWVDVDVNLEGDHLVITLRADSVPNNIRLLRRARAFAAREQESAGTQ